MGPVHVWYFEAKTREESPALRTLRVLPIL